MNDEIDITADLGGLDDGHLGDVQQNAALDAAPITPEGAQPKNADAKPVAAKPEVKDEATSLRDQLSSAFKGTEEKPAAEAAPAVQAPALTKDGEGRYRQSDGTFASAEQVAAFEAKASAASAPADVPETALAGMTPLEQEQFKSLPAELRQYVGRTMEGLNAVRSQYQEYDFLEAQVIGPRREAWTANGMTAPVAMNQLLALSDFASTDPAKFVLWFAQAEGLDLDVLLDEAEAQAANTDPEVVALRNTVSQMQGQLQQMQQAPQEVAQQERLTLVQSFAQEKDEAGQPKRPYLTDVISEFGVQVGAIRSANPSMPNVEVLSKAYDNACWANPTVRTKMQEATRQEAQRTEAARVAAAKRAGASITGAPAGNGSTDPASADNNLSLRDQLSAQFAAARA